MAIRQGYTMIAGAGGSCTGENSYTAQNIAEVEEKIASGEIKDGMTIYIKEDTGSEYDINNDKIVFTESEELEELENEETLGEAMGKIAKGIKVIGDNKENISQLSNPNLIINPDFRINQRGLTEYSDICFTVDRWKNVRVGKVTVENDGILLTSVNGDVQITQTFEDYAVLENQTVTLSVSVNGVIKSATGVIPTVVGANTSACFVQLDDVADIGRCAIRVINDSVFVQIWWNNPETPVKINWVKLEYGSVATPFIPTTVNWLEMMKCGIPDDSSLYGYKQAVPNSLPSTGGVLNGNMYMSNKNPAIIMDYAKDERIAQFGATTSGVPVIVNKKDNSNFVHVFINDYTSQNLLSIANMIDGVQTNYVVHSTKNKPSGKYTGDGSATTRTINTGGIGNVLVIRNGDYLAYVSSSGAIMKNGTTLKALSATVIKFVDGILTMSTSDDIVNKSGIQYSYQVL